MKKLLIGLLTLTSTLSYAQSGKKNSQVKVFEKLRNSYGVELQEELAAFYRKNGLDHGRKYLLVKNDVHPGLSCVSAGSLPNREDIEIRNDSLSVQIFPLPLDADGQGNVVTTCRAVTFVSTESYEAPGIVQAINNSFDSMVISEDEIISVPENVAHSRTINLQNGRALKIDRFKYKN
jgi:hypothetical protein